MAEELVDFSYQPASTGRRRKKPKKTPAGLIAAVIAAVIVGAIAIAAVVMYNNTTTTNNAEPGVETKHKITGGVWVANKQGGTEIMRGVDVYLFPQQIDAETAKNILLDQKNNWIEAINRDRIKIEQDKATVAAENAHRNMFHDYQAVQAIDEKRLQEEEAGLEKIDNAIRAATAPVPVAEMYQQARELAMNQCPLFRCGSIASAKTSVEGKFSIEGIADGDYYLCAGISNDVLHVEWCVPTTVSGSDHVQDLGDSNAQPSSSNFK